MKINRANVNYKTFNTEVKNKTQTSFKDALKNIESTWNSVQLKSQNLILTLPSAVKPLVQTQLMVNELSLKSQMITKVGESLASTLRRIQQFGA